MHKCSSPCNTLVDCEIGDCEIGDTRPSMGRMGCQIETRVHVREFSTRHTGICQRGACIDNVGPWLISPCVAHVTAQTHQCNHIPSMLQAVNPQQVSRVSLDVHGG